MKTIKKQIKKQVKTTAPKSAKKKPQARLASFKLREVKGVMYFTPVNKKSKKLAHQAGRRTLVTKSDLKMFNKQGNLKFGLYIPVDKSGKKFVLKALAV